MLIVTLVVWTLVVPVAVILGAYAWSAAGAHRLARKERTYQPATPAPLGQVLRLPTAERPIQAPSSARRLA